MRTEISMGTLNPGGLFSTSINRLLGLLQWPFFIIKIRITVRAALLLTLVTGTAWAGSNSPSDDFYEYAEVVTVVPYYVMGNYPQDCFFPEHVKNNLLNTNSHTRECTEEERRSAQQITVPEMKGYKVTARFLGQMFETVIPEKVPVGARIKIAVNIAVVSPITVK